MKCNTHTADFPARYICTVLYAPSRMKPLFSQSELSDMTRNGAERKKKKHTQRRKER